MKDTSLLQIQIKLMVKNTIKSWGKKGFPKGFFARSNYGLDKIQFEFI